MGFVVRPRSSFTTDQHRDWIHSAEPDAAKRRLALEALDAFDRSANAGKLAPADLAAITEAACSRHRRVWDIGTDMLMRVACKWCEGQAATRQILNSAPANARFQITAAITGDLPQPFATEIIRLALHDKSARVRDKAAEACGRLKLKELLPDLERRLTVERDTTVRESLEFFIAMLREGYLLKYRGREPILWVQTPGGYCSPALTQADIDGGRLPELIAKAAKGLFWVASYGGRALGSAGVEWEDGPAGEPCSRAPAVATACHRATTRGVRGD
jgi:hypothetical protein